MPILQVQNLSKSYSGVKALESVQLSLEAGEVHALMGENGAGKSTFMKILIGLVQPDAGEIIFQGELLQHITVAEALKRGIAMIHQEILMVPELTVAQNIFLGREHAESNGWFRGLLNDKAINDKTTGLLERLGVNIAPTARMATLSVAQMQMVEIAKAISNDARVIIMDEPTSAISDKEVDILFGIIRQLKAEGVAIIYISHKMDEIFEIADTITVLRDGKYVVSASASGFSRKSLIAHMVGREIEQLFPERDGAQGAVVLAVKDLGKAGKFENVSFEVHSGEIVGLAGLMGAGRTEVARVISGLDQAESGEVHLHGQVVRVKSPSEAIIHRIGYVSEDRKRLGFIPMMSVQENMTLSSLSQHKRGVFVSATSERSATGSMIESLRIKCSDPTQPVTFLSGGNQQKVVIGRVLMASPEVIILDEPTRGVDIGAKFEIYKLIRQLASQGLAVVLISSELPEVIGLSDKIVVLSKGRQTATLTKEEATQERIMHYAVH